MRALILIAALVLAAGPALADPVEGEWLSKEKDGRIRITPCPGRAERMCGAISFVKDRTQPLDVRNPDPALRSRALVGLQILRDFARAAPGRWTGGRIYDPKTGKTYDSKLSINADGSLKLEGCISILCQTRIWTRD